MRRQHLLGMMQGRFSPPSNGKIQSFPKQSWKKEFEAAKNCGLDLIEWIFEADDWYLNPFATENGLSEIKKISMATGVQVKTVCADYFMDLPFLRISESERLNRVEMLKWVIEQTSRLEAKYLVIPFVDPSAIHTPAEMETAAACLKAALPIAEKFQIFLALETSLDPQNFESLLSLLNHPLVGVNYDIGNSASLGYDPQKEFAAYGKSLLTIHIKDRKLGGTTVPLGTGDARFDQVFESLKSQNFRGPFIFQAARQGDEFANATKNLKFVEPYLHALES